MMTRNLPEQYRQCPETLMVSEAVSGILELQFDHGKEILTQLELETATWGLALWERELGIVPDVTKPYDQRRSRIRAKMRGQGTTTVAMLKNLAESFVNGEVAVEELKRQYKITIRFTSRYGIPPNIDDLSRAIEEVIPAHVDYQYRYTHFTWPMVDKQNITWDELSQTAMDWTEFERGEWLNV